MNPFDHYLSGMLKRELSAFKPPAGGRKELLSQARHLSGIQKFNWPLFSGQSNLYRVNIGASIAWPEQLESLFVTRTLELGLLNQRNLVA